MRNFHFLRGYFCFLSHFRFTEVPSLSWAKYTHESENAYEKLYLLQTEVTPIYATPHAIYVRHFCLDDRSSEHNER